MIDLRQLECFCAVVRSGSFSKAAAALAMGQPGLSRQVRKLEDQVGAQLLYRNGRGVALTPSGSRFHETVSDLIVKLKSAYDMASDERASPSGTVALGLPASMGGLIGAPVLLKLKQRWPGIKLHIVDGFSGHVHEWLLSGRVDLAILHDARHTPTITVEHLLSEDLFLVGRAAPPLLAIADNQPAVALADIATLPLIAPGPDHGLRRQLNRVCADSGIILNVENDVDSLTTIKELARRGAGHAILPIGCVYTDIADGGLKAWRIVRPCVVNTMVLAAAGNRPYTSAMREVRRAIRDAIAERVDQQIGWHRPPEPSARDKTPLSPPRALPFAGLEPVARASARAS